MTTAFQPDIDAPYIPILPEELTDFRTEATEFLAGNRDEAKFTGYRLKQGVYGQRQPDVHMVRVKLPLGGVTADQMDAFAVIAERYAPLSRGHITTRENFQFHHIPLDLMIDVLDLLGAADLSSREACGNTVRNVTADPWSGVRADEVFDPTRYGAAFVRYWVRNPISQLLPRKFKVFFTGSEDEMGIAGIHDIGFLSQIRRVDGNEVRGFKMIVGGGLSTAAKEALVIDDFVPVEDFLRVSEAIIRIFHSADELRKNILKARIKFLVHRVGAEAFRAMIQAELRKEWAQAPIRLEDYLLDDDEAAAAPPPPSNPPVPNGDRSAFDAFVAASVRPQRQDGYSAVEVKVPRGDLGPEQFRGLAQIMRTHGSGRARATYTQNMVLRWIPNSAVYAVWQDLQAIGLGDGDAGLISDVMSCPGTDSCKLGITSSMGLNLAIQEKLREMAITDPLTLQMRIHMSGCPNSCGQHHLASIGFHGAAIKSGRRQVPAYHVFVGGSSRHGTLRFGKLLRLRIPAKRAPTVVERFVRMYQAQRQDGEDFNAFVDRVGPEPLEQAAQDLTLPPEFTPDNLPFFIDWSRTDIYVLERGEGECAV